MVFRVLKTAAKLPLGFLEKDMKTKFLMAFVALSLGVGCASMKVNTDYAREADFTKFETFAYKDTENNVADTNQLGHRRIVEGIRREMLAKGLQEAGNNADLFVTYYGEDQENGPVGCNYFHCDSRFIVSSDDRAASLAPRR